ncbi:hypothetical protein MJG53_019245 [Ovis ammon polii x Ovis aries]|uniref:Uncharacterized protein n=1 Tax=Ovis ammon polii x Ovis aries TaxID=2918886 RepID=A0ACB9U2N5_9CETA|nr:hypothetical protein MJG53_019245 [Ovis ammon polii x Ovis aries]
MPERSGKSVEGQLHDLRCPSCLGRASCKRYKFADALDAFSQKYEIGKHMTSISSNSYSEENELRNHGGNNPTCLQQLWSPVGRGKFLQLPPEISVKVQSSMNADSCMMPRLKHMLVTSTSKQVVGASCSPFSNCKHSLTGLLQWWAVELFPSGSGKKNLSQMRRDFKILMTFHVHPSVFPVVSTLKKMFPLDLLSVLSISFSFCNRRDFHYITSYSFMRLIGSAKDFSVIGAFLVNSALLFRFFSMTMTSDKAHSSPSMLSYLTFSSALLLQGKP